MHNKQEICKRCMGQGKIPQVGKMVQCPNCSGQGQFQESKKTLEERNRDIFSKPEEKKDE